METSIHSFVMVPDSIIRDRRLTFVDQIVYSAVLSLTFGAKGYFASSEYFAKRFGITPRSVNRSLAKLHEFGMLQKVGDTYFAVT